MLNSSSAGGAALCLFACACLAAGVARAGVVIANTRVVFLATRRKPPFD